MKLQNVGSNLSRQPLSILGDASTRHIRNCWDPRTWTDSFEIAKSPAKPAPFVRPIDTPIETYMTVAAQAMDSGNATRVTDTAQLRQLALAHQAGQGHDITPPFTNDNDQTMFLLDGRIFVRVVGFAGPAHAQWYEVPAPRF